MSTTTSEGRVNIGRLILIPSLITLAITIIRLIGELQHWNTRLFNPAPGGGGALVGITWLVPILGVYFGLKLSSNGAGPEKVSRVFLFVLIGVIVIVLSSLVAGALGLNPGGAAFILIQLPAAIISILIMQRPWPSLFKTLVAYGYAARIPVAILMLFAIRGNWGTHYDVAPDASFPAMHWVTKWILIGAIPQLIFWITFTVLFGSLFAAIAVAIAHRRKTSEQAPATS
jgi:hypothetical protein